MKARSAIAQLLLAQVAIGASAIFARFALMGGGPIAVSALRLLLASVPIVALCGVRREYRSFAASSEWRLAAGGCALAAHFALWIASLQYQSVGVCTLLVCTTPIWTELLIIARTRQVRAIRWVSITLGMLGVALIAVPQGTTTMPLGIGLALGGALAFALYLTLIRASDGRYTTLAIIGRTYPFAALVLLAMTALSHDHIPACSNTRAWGGVVAMALISQLFGHTALNAAVRRVSPTLVATSTLLEPVIAALLAMRIFGEHVSPSTLAASALILTGIGIALTPVIRRGSGRETCTHILFASADNTSEDDPP